MKKLTIIYDGSLFPQRINAFETLQMDVIENKFKEKGFQIERTTYEDIVNNNFIVKDSFVFYASSQIQERKLFIDDVLYYINNSKNNNILLPSYEIFRCHENKGFQEIYKKQVGIDSLNGSYHVDYQEGNESKKFVLKLLDGFGSRGVFLVNSSSDFKKKYNSKFKSKKLGLFVKQSIKKILGKKITEDQKTYISQLQSKRYIKQPLVPHLECDYKVLVFAEKLYVLKRYVRKNDFRASGSGLWELATRNNIPDQVLDFSYDCYKKLDVPFASLDICYDGEKSHLIEFQGIHFGPLTLIKSKGYFCYTKSWDFIEKESYLEEEMAISLLEYIKIYDNF